MMHTRMRGCKDAFSHYGWQRKFHCIEEKLRLDPQGKKKAALKFYEHFLPRFFACFMCRRRHANKLLTQQKTNAALNTAVTLPACLLFRDRVKGEGWVSHKKAKRRGVAFQEENQRLAHESQGMLLNMNMGYLGTFVLHWLRGCLNIRASGCMGVLLLDIFLMSLFAHRDQFEECARQIPSALAAGPISTASRYRKLNMEELG